MSKQLLYLLARFANPEPIENGAIGVAAGLELLEGVCFALCAAGRALLVP